MIVFGDVMDKAECSPLQMFFVHFDARLFVPVLFEDIVIAFDQVYVDAGQVLAPSSEKRQFAVLSTVKKISHDEQLPGLEILYLRQQPVKVFLVDGGWHGDTGFAEMSCFAKMKIGEDERFFLFPEDATFR